MADTDLNELENNVVASLTDFLQSNVQTQIVVTDLSADNNNVENANCCCDDNAQPIVETLSFTYSIKTLFDIVHMRTSYFGRNVRDDNNVSQVDSVAITLDEWDVFYRLCKEGASNVYSVLQLHSKDVENGYLFDVADSSIIKMLFGYYKRSFDVNLLKVLNTIIETAIIYYIIAKWFETIGLNKQYSVYWGYFEQELLKLNDKAKSRKMKSAQRKYRWL